MACIRLSGRGKSWKRVLPSAGSTAKSAMDQGLTGSGAGRGLACRARLGRASRCSGWAAAGGAGRSTAGAIGAAAGSICVSWCGAGVLPGLNSFFSAFSTIVSRCDMGSASGVKEALKTYYAQRPCSALQPQPRRQPVADVTDLGGADLMGHGVGVPGSGMASGLQQVMGPAAHLRLQDVVMQAV